MVMKGITPHVAMNEKKTNATQVVFSLYMMSLLGLFALFFMKRPLLGPQYVFHETPNTLPRSFPPREQRRWCFFCT